ncbi:MAG: hypothetical protein ABJD68_15260 [Nakamurella sp.]
MNVLMSAESLAPGDPGDPSTAATSTPTSAPAAAATGSSAPPAGGDGLIPAVKPDMNSTGMAGFTNLINTIAGWTLLSCLAGFILSGLVFVLGPAFGIRHGRQYGAIGMMAALGIAASVGMATGLVNLAYTMFSGA